jgi:hypothetical protein
MIRKVLLSKFCVLSVNVHKAKFFLLSRRQLDFSGQKSAVPGMGTAK